MVDLDDTKPKVFAKVKYPSLTELRENPSAPPVVNVGTDDRGHQYRLKYIQDIQRYFEEEIKQRQAFSKKYFRVAKIINWVDNGLITITIGAEGVGAIMLATGAGAPVALALGISGAATGLISLMGNIFNKKATAKAEKHLKISQTAISKLDTIASHISKALMDDFVSPEEFNLILEEMNKYKTLKEEIRSNNKKKLKKEEEENLINKGREEAKASFRRLVETNNKFETL